MIKRLLAAALLSILFVLGMQWVSVNPVYATALNGSSLAPSTTSSKFIVTVQNHPSLVVGDLHPHPSIRIIAPPSTSFATTSLHEVAINLNGTDQVNLTEPITLTGVLTDLSTRQGIPDKTITISTFGVVLGQTHTDSNGAYQIEIHRDLPAGKYQVTAAFKGAHLLAPASTVFSIEINPATFTVQTVPAVAGITFQMDGRLFVSDQDGRASINVNHAGSYRLDMLINRYSNPSTEVKFGRWSDDFFQPYRNITVPSNKVTQVGLTIYHKVNLKFFDLEGFPVDPSRISEITIRSVQGDSFTLKPGDSPWMPSSRTARYHTGLEVTDLMYSVNSVTIDGSNVVNSAQQRFYAKQNDTWSISLLLYSLHVTVRDALFASPTGSAIDVVFPNGQATRYPLDPSGRMDLHALARGIYRVNLIGSKGLGTSTPVALSRNQTVNLKIVTRADMAVVGIGGMLFAMGLIIYGRPWLLGYFLRRRRYSSRMMGKDFGS
jgi:hypothetical protein